MRLSGVHTIEIDPKVVAEEVTDAAVTSKKVEVDEVKNDSGLVKEKVNVIQLLRRVSS